MVNMSIQVDNYLPNELLLNIFGFLKKKEYPKISSICSTWKTLAATDQIWKDFYEESYQRFQSLDGTTNLKHEISEFKKHCQEVDRLVAFLGESPILMPLESFIPHSASNFESLPLKKRHLAF